MKNVILISCVSRKLAKETEAKDLYISDLFKKNMTYAKTLNPDGIYILSAKYGLLGLNDKISPYDVTLNHMKSKEKKEWASKVLLQINDVMDINNTNFIFLAGDNYRKHLLPFMPNFEIPMKGLKIGFQLQFLKEKLSMKQPCDELHNIFNNLERLKFPFEGAAIPQNGIYILFEKSETGHNNDRVVRIGTHTGEGQLHSRLNQHFIKEIKDRSIFRKNIGRAFLNKSNDEFLQQWEWDLTTRANKEKYLPLLDVEKQRDIEKVVSKYIQKNMSFVVFEVNDKKERLHLESRIISTVSHCKECCSSNSWLGQFSPKEKIQNSSLWLVNELYKTPSDEEDIKKIKELCKRN